MFALKTPAFVRPLLPPAWICATQFRCERGTDLFTIRDGKDVRLHPRIQIGFLHRPATGQYLEARVDGTVALAPANLSPKDAESLGMLMAASRVVSFATAREGRVVLANAAFAGLFGHAGSLADIELQNLLVEDDRPALARALTQAQEGLVSIGGTGLRADGSTFDLEMHLEVAQVDGEPTAIVTATDVTEFHRSETQLSYMAFSDALTGLANRACFADRLRLALREARTQKWPLAVLMIDLDGFKPVNDTYGHDAGDTLLQLVAQRVKACVRDSDTAARLGGDEFAILLPRIKATANAGIVAGSVVQALRAPFDLGQREVNVRASIGIAVFPDHADTLDPLMAAADTALYQAKREGRDRYCWAEQRADAPAPAAHRLTWNVAHEIKIRELDEQHAKLSELIDHLSEGLKEGRSPAELMEEFRGVLAYASHHFATEEGLMARHNVVNAAAHCRVHARLLEDLRSLSADNSAANVSLTVRYLQEWLFRHIDSMDKQLGHTLAACGVA